MEKTNMSIHVGMTNCDKILKLFKTLSNEKKLEVFIKLRDILWETKDAIHEREESSAYFNQALLRLRQRNDS
jgi:DNA-binding transcriptional ArsR family regulator